MKVAVECYPDEVLLRVLGVPKRQLLHEARKGEVLNWLKKTPGGIGMVDEDPDSAQPRDLSNYQEAEVAEGLRLLIRRGGSGQRLIVICPRLEDWLIQRAAICGVDPKRYHLPSHPSELHNIPRYDQKEGLRRFLAELNDHDNGMRLLRQWIVQGERSSRV
jgi:hypothetical protein